MGDSDVWESAGADSVNNTPDARSRKSTEPRKSAQLGKSPIKRSSSPAMRTPFEMSETPEIREMEVSDPPPKTSSFPAFMNSRGVLIVQYEIVLLIPVILVSWWIYDYLGGLDWSSENKLKFNWHPLAMIIGFIFLYGNGAVAYRLFPFGRSTNKKIHAILNLLATAFAIFGIVAVVEYHLDWGYSNLYTLHSWLGCFTVTVFTILALFSAVVFQDFDKSKLPDLRKNFKMYHIFLGVFMVMCVVITIVTGLIEKGMFRSLWTYDLEFEAYLVNVICASVVLAFIYMIYILYSLTIVYARDPRPLFHCGTDN